jgi:hypothetical protein
MPADESYALHMCHSGLNENIRFVLYSLQSEVLAAVRGFLQIASTQFDRQYANEPDRPLHEMI